MSSVFHPRAGASFALAFAIGYVSVASASSPSPVLLATGAASQSEYGTIKGRLVWAGSEVPPEKNLIEKGKAPKDAETCGNSGPIVSRELVVDPATKGVSYGFVYLARPNGSNPDAVKALLAKAPKVELDQKGCEFLPYALCFHQDQKLVIKSSDPVNHNVRYAAFANSPFNQILGPMGQVEISLVAEKRPIVVACDIHSWMKSYLMVFDHPFFAITGKDGSFEITGVPAGAQNVVLWQEKVGYVDAKTKAKGIAVTVTAGGVTDMGDVKLEPSQVK